MISNFDHRLYRILEGLGLSDQFQSITISSEAGYAKPSPEIFRIAVAKHAITADEAMHVGDSDHLDLAGAVSAGSSRRRTSSLTGARHGVPERSRPWASTDSTSAARMKPGRGDRRPAASRARERIASGKLSPSIFIMKLKTVPPAPHPKQ